MANDVPNDPLAHGRRRAGGDGAAPYWWCCPPPSSPASGGFSRLDGFDKRVAWCGRPTPTTACWDGSSRPRPPTARPRSWRRFVSDRGANGGHRPAGQPARRGGPSPAAGDRTCSLARQLLAHERLVEDAGLAMAHYRQDQFAEASRLFHEAAGPAALRPLPRAGDAGPPHGPLRRPRPLRLDRSQPGPHPVPRHRSPARPAGVDQRQRAGQLHPRHGRRRDHPG